MNDFRAARSLSQRIPTTLGCVRFAGDYRAYPGSTLPFRIPKRKPLAFIAIFGTLGGVFGIPFYVVHYHNRGLRAAAKAEAEAKENSS